MSVHDSNRAARPRIAPPQPAPLAGGSLRERAMASTLPSRPDDVDAIPAPRLPAPRTEVGVGPNSLPDQTQLGGRNDGASTRAPGDGFTAFGIHLLDEDPGLSLIDDPGDMTSPTAFDARTSTGRRPVPQAESHVAVRTVAGGIVAGQEWLEDIHDYLRTDSEPAVGLPPATQVPRTVTGIPRRQNWESIEATDPSGHEAAEAAEAPEPDPEDSLGAGVMRRARRRTGRNSQTSDAIARVTSPPRTAPSLAAALFEEGDLGHDETGAARIVSDQEMVTRAGELPPEYLAMAAERTFRPREEAPPKTGPTRPVVQRAENDTLVDPKAERKGAPPTAAPAPGPSPQIALRPLPAAASPISAPPTPIPAAQPNAIRRREVAASPPPPVPYRPDPLVALGNAWAAEDGPPGSSAHAFSSEELSMPGANVAESASIPAPHERRSQWGSGNWGAAPDSHSSSAPAAAVRRRASSAPLPSPELPPEAPSDTVPMPAVPNPRPRGVPVDAGDAFALLQDPPDSKPAVQAIPPAPRLAARPAANAGPSLMQRLSGQLSFKSMPRDSVFAIVVGCVVLVVAGAFGLWVLLQG